MLFSYNFCGYEDESKLFYVYGVIDKEIGFGLVGWLGCYDFEIDFYLLEGCVFGNFELFGCSYEVNFGVSYVISDDVFFVYVFDYVIIFVYGLILVFLYGLDVIVELEWLGVFEYLNIE